MYVEVCIQIGPIGFIWCTRLYLRECIVEKLNWKRAPEERLHYSSKYTLTRARFTEYGKLEVYVNVCFQEEQRFESAVKNAHSQSAISPLNFWIGS